MIRGERTTIAKVKVEDPGLHALWYLLKVLNALGVTHDKWSWFKLDNYMRRQYDGKR